MPLKYCMSCMATFLTLFILLLFVKVAEGYKYRPYAQKPNIRAQSPYSTILFNDRFCLIKSRTDGNCGIHAASLNSFSFQTKINTQDQNMLKLVLQQTSFRPILTSAIASFVGFGFADIFSQLVLNGVRMKL
jgi:hypothetical protein